MKTSWDTLNSKTRSFRTLLEAPDNDKGEIRDVVFSGLHVKFSEIVKNRAAGIGKTLTIYADTLVMDRPSLDASVAVVVARRIDVSALNGNAITMPRAVPGQPSVSLFLIQESAGGSATVAAAKPASGEQPARIPTGNAPLQLMYHTVTSDGKATVEITRRTADMEDLLNKVWAINSLKASFTAATWLADSGNKEDRVAARSMLLWVTACIRSWGGDGAGISSDVADLYNSAAALLVTLDSDAGALYVPVLASAYYSNHVKALLEALSKHETQLGNLNVQTGIAAAIQSVSATLEGAMSDSIVPLQAELDQIDGNIQNLLNDIQVLNRQFYLQRTESDRKLKTLTAEIISDAIYRQMEAILSASFAIIAAVGSAGASLSLISKNPGATLRQGKAALDYFQMDDGSGNKVSALPAIKDALSSVFDGIKEGKKIYDAATEKADEPDNELLQRAMDLMKMQEQSLASFTSSALMVSGPQGSPNLEEVSSADRADPALAWDNFVIAAEVYLKPMESTESGEVKSALAAYQGSLKILAGYGKAVHAKMASASAQMSQATLVRARLRAAEETKERWAALEAKAESDEEKLAALKGILQLRADNLKRSVFVAWRQYRNSFFYLNFQEPPTGVVNLDMDSAELSKAFVSVTEWIARLRGDTLEGRQVRLPNDEVKIGFRLKIVKPGVAAGPGTALLKPKTENEPASLSWTIESGDEQLRGVLPSGGHVAIWITEAKFFIRGVAANAKGNVIGKVSTSGSYQNGFGPQKDYRFETKSLVGNYAYAVAGEKIYNRWKIESEVYATPTPFTQWTFTFDPDGGDPKDATEVRMDLVVAYREAADMATSAARS
jgi:hypothetical protein